MLPAPPAHLAVAAADALLSIERQLISPGIGGLGSRSPLGAGADKRAARGAAFRGDRKPQASSGKPLAWEFSADHLPPGRVGCPRCSWPRVRLQITKHQAAPGQVQCWTSGEPEPGANRIPAAELQRYSALGSRGHWSPSGRPRPIPPAQGPAVATAVGWGSLQGERSKSQALAPLQFVVGARPRRNEAAAVALDAVIPATKFLTNMVTVTVRRGAGARHGRLKGNAASMIHIDFPNGQPCPGATAANSGNGAGAQPQADQPKELWHERGGAAARRWRTLPDPRDRAGDPAEGRGAGGDASMSWPSAYLGEVCSFLSGFAFKSDYPFRRACWPAIIRIRDVPAWDSKTY